MPNLSRLLFAWGILFLGVLVSLAADPVSEDAREDRAVLERAGLAMEGKSLLGFLRQRTLKEDVREKITALIGQLGDDQFDVREKATRALVELGPVVRPQMQEATKHRDLEVRRRAERVLHLTDTGTDALLVRAVLRQLGRTAPAGTIDTLLAYLPNTEDSETVDLLISVLGRVGVKDGKVDPALVAALSHKQPLIRGAAGDALRSSRSPEVRDKVRKLLTDPDREVRRRVGLALFEARDKEAVPHLINLLADLSGDDRYQVEQRLLLLAGDKAPTPPDRDTRPALTEYQDAWRKWWKDNEKRTDLARIEMTPRHLGYTIIATLDTGIAGKVYELDSAGRTRWEIKDVRYPIFAQVVGPDRVLVAEYQGYTVSERNFKGEVIWQRPAGGILMGVQRLPGGHLLIVTRTQVRELDRNGKEVNVLNRPSDIAVAARLRDGTLGLITITGQMIRTTWAGKELASFNVGPLSTTVGFRAHFLPNGNVVVPHYLQHEVVEYDSNGKSVWKATLPMTFRPSAVSRLTNGHTLVVSRLNTSVLELDKEGKEVRTRTATGRTLFADQR
jgi:HEAT repeat protein